MIIIQSLKMTKYLLVKVILKLIKVKQIHNSKRQEETKAKNINKVLNKMKKS